VWVRPNFEWIEEVIDKDGEKTSRFTSIDEV
jgi:hypothetical protein